MAAESRRLDIENAVIDVGSLVSSMEDELGKFDSLSMPPSSIFKIPSILYRHKQESFIPNCFSIGPLHLHNTNLERTKKIKVKYFNDLMSRVLVSRSMDTASKEIKKAEQKKILTEWFNAVKSIEKEASACYGGYHFAGDEFVTTMVFDGVFIIELFRKDAKEVNIEPDDPIFSMSCMLQFLHHDLILLENQIPWVVLKTLFKKTRLPSEKTNSLIELTLKFFATDLTYEGPPIKPSLFKGKEVKHVLDLLRLYFVLPSKVINNTDSLNAWQPIRSATKLEEAGVTFRRAKNADSILDIKYYKNGILEIPPLTVQETTETILRNLIAYEQCLPNCKPIFTSYAKLLDNLIDSTNDIEILCKKDILDNWFSPQGSIQSFNNLYLDTYVKEFYYCNLCQDLEKHCGRKWPKLRAAYVQNYFSKPWAIVAQIYSIIILVFTVWQTLK